MLSQSHNSLRDGQDAAVMYSHLLATYLLLSLYLSILVLSLFPPLSSDLFVMYLLLFLFLSLSLSLSFSFSISVSPSPSFSLSFSIRVLSPSRYVSLSLSLSVSIPIFPFPSLSLFPPSFPLSLSLFRYMER